MVFRKRTLWKQRPRLTRKTWGRKRPRVSRSLGMSTRQTLSSYPSNKVVNMRYASFFSMQSSATAINYHFRANSLFDPDAEFGGHSAMGFDQWAQFYEKYVIISSTIECTFMCQSTGVLPVICAIMLSDDDTDVADVYRLIEQGSCVYKTMQPAVNGNPVLKLKYRYKAKTWHSVKDVADAEELEANFDVNPQTPPDQTYYKVIVAVSNQVGDTPQVHGVVKLNYKVLLKDPRILQSSGV